MVEVIKTVFEVVFGTAKSVVQFVGVGPFLTFLGIVSALVFPLLREQKRRRRQDAITVRGLLLYLEVLEEKSDTILKVHDDLRIANDHWQRIREALGAAIRKIDDDPRVVEARRAIDILMYRKPAPGSFEAENLKNHDAIERLFVSSELSNLDQRSTLLEFIKYFKGIKQMQTPEDYQGYRKQLDAVLNCLRATKGGRAPPRQYVNRSTGLESQL